MSAITSLRQCAIASLRLQANRHDSTTFPATAPSASAFDNPFSLTSSSAAQRIMAMVDDEVAAVSEELLSEKLLSDTSFHFYEMLNNMI